MKQKLILALIVIITAGNLRLAESFFEKFRMLEENLRSIRSTTLEQRRSAKYADLGYEYIDKVRQGCPTQMPLVRFSDYNRRMDLLLLGQAAETDPRIMLVINATEAFKPGFLKLINNFDSKVSSSWSLKTRDDIDQLKALRLTPAVCPSAHLALKIEIFKRSDDLTTILSENHRMQCQNKQSTSITLDKPVNNFSFGRGETPFKINIISSEPLEWESVEAEVIKIDGSKYHLINQSGNNYTFIQKEFFNQVVDAKDAVWLKWISKLDNV